MKRVKIYVHQGVIEVVDVPEGVELEIHDYDIDDFDRTEILKDENGDEYVGNIHQSDGTIIEQGD